MSHAHAPIFFAVSLAAVSMLGCGVAVGDASEGTASASLIATSSTGDSAPTGPYECPAYYPLPGQSCTGDYACNIATSCSTIATATCSGGTWTLDNPSGCGPSDTSVSAPGTFASCPTSSLPVLGSYCGKDGLQCQYLNACQGADTYACTGSAWTFSGTSCPAETCPSAPPAAGSVCRTAGLGCTYTDRKTVTAFCDGTQWTYPSSNTRTSKRR